MRRIDTPEFPTVAVREALMNAVLHADYSIIGTSIMVAIFDDRIEISNPGGMPLGITMERALEGASRIRNRVIARVFRELELSEQWGSGLKKIINACEKHGVRAPKFDDFGTEFKVTLYATQDLEDTLDPAQEKVIKHLLKKEKLGTTEAAEILGIAPRNARVKLKKWLMLVC